jgi:hypothetical protein
MNKNLSLSVKPNDNFNNYSFKDSRSYDFFIYSPKTVLYKENLDSFLENPIDLKSRPVITKDKVIKKIDSTANVFYKIDPLNPTKYAMEIKLDKQTEPIIIQFNQLYSRHWRVRLIDKTFFDRYECKGLSRFSVTGNTRCQTEFPLFDISNSNLLLKKNIPEQNHYVGNLISNTWVLSPRSFSDSKKTIYAVIIYEKQIFYEYMIFISFLAGVFLFFAASVQEIRRIKNNDKK